MAGKWNPALYESSHAFVWEYGRELLKMLSATEGERVLDLGCGTGQLTSEIAASGAQVIGVDKSASMIEQARRNYPNIDFQIADAEALPFRGEFDAVFSNAALHWVLNADAAAAGIAKALKPGGRFVAEFGGKGNIRVFLEAAHQALEKLGIPPESWTNPWFYPSIAEYSALLESHGLEVTFATLFDRPTQLEDSERALEDWINMFCGSLTAGLTEAQKEDFVRLTTDFARPQLFRNGRWMMDYRRLRIAAVVS